MQTILQTDRLILRELGSNDYNSLRGMLQDEKVMYAYEGAFSETMVKEWYDKQLTRYRNDGFGLWSVIEKATGKWIGQCGLTYQDYNGKTVLEVGYLLCSEQWGNGYATEAAKGCIKYAFDTLGVNEVYSIIRDNNIPSQKVALRNGLVKVGEVVKFYRDTIMPHDVFCIENK